MHDNGLQPRYRRWPGPVRHMRRKKEKQGEKKGKWRNEKDNTKPRKEASKGNTKT